MASSTLPRRRWSKKRIVLTTLGFVTVVVLLYQWWTGSAPTAPVTIVSGSEGSYGSLTTAQRRLVDDWVARFSAASGASALPGEVYEGLSLSTRTTFNAVTHALSRTALTDGAGQSMNLSALDLISKVDAIAGSVPGAGGDRQFRMYVQLRPDAQERLEQSREFIRQVDNTVYHKGYPICFRGSGGTPSIQFSIARDGTHGDIDVDYRASAFPIMLINGHLTASNSDVRAGNNDERHNGQWSGFMNWWRGFMGVPLAESLSGAAEVAATANAPRLGKGTKSEDAINDFLQAWLVEASPAVAVGYVAPAALSCLEVDRGQPVDRGVARFQLVKAMQAINARVGKAGRLTDVIRGVSLVGPRGKEIPQPYHDAFVMYDVREDLAESFNCDNQLHPEQADPARAQSTKFGEYVGAVFQVRTAALTGDSVATIWARENGAWMLVSYDVEPEFKPGVLPSAPPPAPVSSESAAETVAGDPAMQRAARDFLQAWFVRKDTAAAFRYVAPSSFACYNVYRSDDAAAAGSPAEAGQLIQERMKLLGDWAGTGGRLEEVLSAVEPTHPDLKPVKHDDAEAYAIVSVPDAMAAAADCSQLQRGGSPKFVPATAPVYGHFYAVSLRLKRAGPEAGVLWTLWGRQENSWKIASYLVVTP